MKNEVLREVFTWGFPQEMKSRDGARDVLRGAGKAGDFPGIPPGNEEQEWNNSKENRASASLGRRRNLAQEKKDKIQIPEANSTWKLHLGPSKPELGELQKEFPK